MTTVEFDNVSKEFGPVRALSRVSLSVELGEFATLLGPSGSGKTTALSLLSGILQPSSGRILIGGRDVTNVRAAGRNIGLVFQSYALFPHMTVYENVAFPLRIRRLPALGDRQPGERGAGLRPTGHVRRAKPHQLSGGQQQRVALARAIVFKPDILLLDEPLAALDRKLRDDVRAEIHRLQRRLGITTIMVTHDQDEALSMSDRIVVLDGGRVQQIDTPANAYYKPGNRFVAGFLGTANFLEGTVTKNGKSHMLALEDGVGVPVPEALLGKVCGMLRPEDVSITDGKGAILKVSSRKSSSSARRSATA